jgi:molybdopterin-binding protein
MASTAEHVLHVEEADPAPAYVQLERQIRVGVADGTLQPGDRLPSVRRLAQRLGLAPNTVGRAYAELAREGVIIARAGGGSEIAPRAALDRPALARARQERLRVLARQVAVRGLALGFEPAEIVEAVNRELATHGRPVPTDTDLGALGSDEAALLSTRNRFRGTVTAIRVGELLAEVTVRLPEGTDSVVAITRASLERLGLAVGRPASVYVKATEQVLGR